MYRDEPKMFPAIILAVIGLPLIILAYYMEEWPEVIRVIFGLVGGVLLIYAGVMSVRWVFYVWDEHVTRAANAAAITPEGAKLKTLRDLRPDQIEVLMRSYVHIEIEPRVGGAKAEYVVDGVKIPDWFMEEFFGKVTADGYLAPIGDWSEGSAGRKYANTITMFYRMHGFALAAAGNKPAKLTIPVEEAIAMFEVK